VIGIGERESRERQGKELAAGAGMGDRGEKDRKNGRLGAGRAQTASSFKNIILTLPLLFPNLFSSVNL